MEIRSRLGEETGAPFKQRVQRLPQWVVGRLAGRTQSFSGFERESQCSGPEGVAKEIIGRLQAEVSIREWWGLSPYGRA